MTAVARKQLRFRLAGARDGSPPCSTGTTGAARPALAGAHRAQGPTPTASGCPRSCCSRRRSRPSSPSTSAFLARWPTVEALAAAPLDDVLAAWAGLGYYSRARNLHKCAQRRRRGLRRPLPGDRGRAAELPGIGPYTAAAIAAIAFGARATPVDGNIERVVARLFAVQTAAARGQARDQAPRRHADAGTARRRFRAGADGPRRQHLHAQAPLVPDVPAAAATAPRTRTGLGSALPARAAKPERPVRVGFAFVALREDGARAAAPAPGGGPARRHAGGALARSGPRRCRRVKEALRAAPVRGDWWAVPGIVSAHLHALPPGDAGLSRAGAGRCRAHLLGRPAALPVGRPPRPRPRRPAQA